MDASNSNDVHVLVTMDINKTVSKIDITSSQLYFSILNNTRFVLYTTILYTLSLYHSFVLYNITLRAQQPTPLTDY